MPFNIGNGFDRESAQRRLRALVKKTARRREEVRTAVRVRDILRRFQEEEPADSIEPIIEASEPIRRYGTSGGFGAHTFQPMSLYRNDTDFLFLDTIFVSLSRSKRIHMTPIVGRADTIKEYISPGEVNISASGFIYNDDNKDVNYPIDNLNKYLEYFDLAQSLAIVQEKINALGVEYIVITKYNLPRKKYQNIQEYTFSAVSDNNPQDDIIN